MADKGLLEMDSDWEGYEGPRFVWISPDALKDPNFLDLLRSMPSLSVMIELGDKESDSVCDFSLFSEDDDLEDEEEKEEEDLISQIWGFEAPSLGSAAQSIDALFNAGVCVRALIVGDLCTNEDEYEILRKEHMNDLSVLRFRGMSECRLGIFGLLLWAKSLEIVSVGLYNDPDSDIESLQKRLMLIQYLLECENLHSMSINAGYNSGLTGSGEADIPYGLRLSQAWGMLLRKESIQNLWGGDFDGPRVDRNAMHFGALSIPREFLAWRVPDMIFSVDLREAPLKASDFPALSRATFVSLRTGTGVRVKGGTWDSSPDNRNFMSEVDTPYVHREALMHYALLECESAMAKALSLNQKLRTFQYEEDGTETSGTALLGALANPYTEELAIVDLKARGGLDPSIVGIDFSSGCKNLRCFSFGTRRSPTRFRPCLDWEDGRPELPKIVVLVHEKVSAAFRNKNLRFLSLANYHADLWSNHELLQRLDDYASNGEGSDSLSLGYFECYHIKKLAEMFPRLMSRVRELHVQSDDADDILSAIAAGEAGLVPSIRVFRIDIDTDKVRVESKAVVDLYLKLFAACPGIERVILYGGERVHDFYTEVGKTLKERGAKVTFEVREH
ncbi:MAG: hypothetical protein KDB07_12165 [Planctomycetes bacterium]|nr:hypothetical protein [Planctomycetota bacterium]